MAKRQVIGLNEAWWVWLGEQPAVRVADQDEAMALMLTQGKEFGVANSHGRCDMATAVAEVLWNDPLPDGQAFHKTIISPVIMVLHNGQLRQFVSLLPPSKFKSTAKGWYAIEPELPAWWPRQYLAAINDPGVLVLRGKRPVKDLLDEKWPAAN